MKRMSGEGFPGKNGVKRCLSVAVCLFLFCTCLGIGVCMRVGAEEEEDEYEYSENGLPTLCVFTDVWDYDEYCKLTSGSDGYFANEKYKPLQEDFLNYEAIQGVGSFVAFDFVGETGYGYRVYDETNFEMILCVSAKGLDAGSFISIYGTYAAVDRNESFTPEELNLGSVMPGKISRDEPVTVVERDGIQFVYKEGCLYSILWEAEDRHFSLEACYPFLLGDYPEEEDGKETFFRKIINAETAQEAIDNIGTVYYERIPTPSPAPTIYWTPSPEPETPGPEA